MKMLLLLLPFLFIGSIRSHSAEAIEPIEFCYSSSECSLFLFHNNSGEFAVDDPGVYDAVRSINTTDFNFSIQRTTTDEMQRQREIARDTKRTLYITNKELIALQRQGQKAINSADRCSWNLAGCATAGTLIAVGKESSKVILALGLVGAVIACKTSAGDSCTDVIDALNDFREDYKNYLLEHEPLTSGGGGFSGIEGGGGGGFMGDDRPIICTTVPGGSVTSGGHTSTLDEETLCTFGS